MLGSQMRSLILAVLTARQSQVLSLQQMLGNRATIQRLIQREEGDDQTDSASSDKKRAPIELALTLDAPRPIKIKLMDSGLGDYPTDDNSDVAMAKRVMTKPVDVNERLQRDDDEGGESSPHIGVDVVTGTEFELSAPKETANWSLDFVLVCRDLTLWELSYKKLFSLAFLKEPQLQLSTDPSGVITPEVGHTLIEANFNTIWGTKLNAAVTGNLNADGPSVGIEGGVEKQVFSNVTINGKINWTYQPGNGDEAQMKPSVFIGAKLQF